MSPLGKELISNCIIAKHSGYLTIQRKEAIEYAKRLKIPSWRVICYATSLDVWVLG